MHPDLYLRTYLRQEHDLTQRLEHRRVALERTTPTGTTRRGPAAVRAALTHVEARLARARHAVREASAPTVCCSPA